MVKGRRFLFVIAVVMFVSAALLPLVLTAKGNSEHFSPVFSVNGSHDFSNVMPFLRQARIVGLGEQTHGAGNVFALKTELIKHLHQHQGFNILALESGMYDVAQLWLEVLQGKSLNELAPGNIFYMYANSAELQPLFDYISKHANSGNPLRLVGFDSQHTGTIAQDTLVSDLKSQLIYLDAKWRNFDWMLLQRSLKNNQPRLSRSEEIQLFRQLKDMQFSLLNVDDGFWYRITKGLEAQIKRQWQIEDTRSFEMGENLNWLASVFPEQKIMVWGHSGHLMKTGHEQVNAGQRVFEMFKNEYYMMHFSAQKGEYLDFVDLTVKAVKEIDDNSLERFAQQEFGNTLTYVDIATFKKPNTDKMELFSVDYQHKVKKEHWPSLYDGVFIFEQARPAEYLAE